MLFFKMGLKSYKHCCNIFETLNTANFICFKNRTFKNIIFHNNFWLYQVINDWLLEVFTFYIKQLIYILKYTKCFCKLVICWQKFCLMWLRCNAYYLAYFLCSLNWCSVRPVYSLYFTSKTFVITLNFTYFWFKGYDQNCFILRKILKIWFVLHLISFKQNLLSNQLLDLLIRLLNKNWGFLVKT